jgi:UDP-N-acetylglucosamine 2-epimerase (non-hydrolysing)
VLAGTSPSRIVELAMEVIDTGGQRGRRPALWDGRAAERIAGLLADRLGKA